MNTTLNKGIVATCLSFAFAVCGAVADGLPDLGWTGGPMSSSGDTIRTDGDVVFAYCGGQTDLETYAINGVTFTANKKLDNIPDDLKPFPLSGSPLMYMDRSGYGNEGVEDTDFAHILDTGWWLNQNGEYAFTLSGLIPNHIYLVQLTFHFPHINVIYKVAASDGTEVHAGSGAYTPETDEERALWKYGGTLVNVFRSMSDSYSFTLNFKQDDQKGYLNSIQLRDLGEGGAIEIDPSVDSVSAKANGATVTVSLKNVQMGTDTEAVAATAYSVYYSLNEGDPVQALMGQASSSATFDIEGLTDGNYTADVWIVTDKGKETEPKMVEFKVNTKVGDYDKVKAAVEAAQQGETVLVPAGVYQATSKISVSQKQVKIIADGNVIINGENCSEGVFNIGRSGAMISGIEFENCTNSAGYGGAICLNNNYHGFVATNCVFRNCAAKMGGAIGGSLNYGEYGAEASDGIPARGELGVITGCTFVDCASTGNSAGSGESGGGSVSGAFWVENSTFEGGSSNFFAPGIYSGFNLMVTNCTFSKIGPASINNTRGIVFMARGNTELCVKDCRFVDTTCQPILGTESNRMLVDRCEFRNCTGSETKPNDMSGSMDYFYGKGTIRNSLVCDNLNPLAMGNQVFENCTIVGNVGGFFLKYNSGKPSPAFTNCVWAKNTRWEGSAYTSCGGPGLCWHGGDPNAYENLSIGSCVFEGASTNDALKVLFTRDESGATKTLTEAFDAVERNFEDPENGNWTPKSKSPLLNAALVLDWMEKGTLDLAGNPRDDRGPDIGCFERVNPRGLFITVR